MPPAKKVVAANEEFYARRPLTAVLIGATAGIGEYAVQALAAQYAKGKQALRVYIVGRSQESASAIISGCSKACSHADLRFVKANDLALIRDTDRVCDEIIALERQNPQTLSPRIDLLVMTQGIVNFGARQETSEGLDRSMSLLYYSRIRFIARLMPLLLASSAPHVVSVHAAGLETKLILSDLSLRHNYSLIQVRSHMTHFTTMAFEKLASMNPQLSLVNVFPGMVITPAYYDSGHPIWFKVVWRLLAPIFRMTYAISHGESGSRTLYAGTSRFCASNAAASAEGPDPAKGTNGQKGSGAYAIGKDCEPVTPQADYVKLRQEGFEATVWQHTMKVFADIEASGQFLE